MIRKEHDSIVYDAILTFDENRLILMIFDDLQVKFVSLRAFKKDLSLGGFDALKVKVIRQRAFKLERVAIRFYCKEDPENLIFCLTHQLISSGLISIQN